MRGKRGWAICLSAKISLQQTLVTMAMAIRAGHRPDGLQGLRAALITLVLIWGLGWALKRTLGGQTGDTLGAAIELGRITLFTGAAVRPDTNGEEQNGNTFGVTCCHSAARCGGPWRALQQHIDGLLKPPGSLGSLETLAVQLAGLPGLQGQLALAEKAIVVMCADHGVWHEGVTPSPQGVTAIHAGNMVRGNTGVCVLAAQAGARVQVVDVGIDADPLPA
ncbi:nicotinate-nucleotide-dimethylbenzimidazole phosphoribosyltransferase [Klebsiella pneumoniae subsp. rhinoscleromatis]|nr:nicotinate-nucleotide-dimethylbenzimidazole phosphoribosyltransferase [Klebsiella pneumoniae subsp. rhinoscleromatis]